MWRAVPWSESIEPEGRAAGEFAHGAKRDESIEQPPQAPVAHGSDPCRRQHGVVIVEPLDHGGGALGAQARRDGDEFLRIALELGEEIAGVRRRAPIGESAAVHPV